MKYKINLSDITLQNERRYMLKYINLLAIILAFIVLNFDYWVVILSNSISFDKKVAS